MVYKKIQKSIRNSSIKKRQSQTTPSAIDQGVQTDLSSEKVTNANIPGKAKRNAIKGRIFGTEVSEDRTWQRHKNDLRQTIASQERNFSKFDSDSAVKNLKVAFTKALSDISGTQLQERVDDLRAMIDRLPEYFTDHVVNAAHTALNAFDRQVGMPGLSYLAPSKTNDDKHVINRGITEAVLIEGEYYTPIYITVFGDALKNSVPEYKDVGQDPQGRIQVHSGGGEKGENTLWISIGRPLRQVKWMEKYSAQYSPEPLIRSFLVPMEIADLISGESITEHGASGLGKDLNVDKHYERNQFGVVSEKSLEMLRRYALPGSLRTYTDQATNNRPKNWGDVRSSEEIRTRLGVPIKPIPDFPIFVEKGEITPQGKSQAEFTSQGKYQQQADTLSRIYAYYTDNVNFLPMNDEGETEAMPSDRKDKVRAFYLQHRPHDFPEDDSGIPAFIEEYVAPWATQAKIAKAIADDYEDLVGQERKDLPTKALSVSYGGEKTSNRRGQRRPEAVALAKKDRLLLETRYQFLMCLKEANLALNDAFKKLPSSHQARSILGKLRREIAKIDSDYGFKIGNIDIVTKQLPIYRQSILDLQQQLANEKINDHELIAKVVVKLEAMQFGDIG